MIDSIGCGCVLCTHVRKWINYYLIIRILITERRQKRAKLRHSVHCNSYWQWKTKEIENDRVISTWFLFESFALSLGILIWNQVGRSIFGSLLHSFLVQLNCQLWFSLCFAISCGNFKALWPGTKLSTAKRACRRSSIILKRLSHCQSNQNTHQILAETDTAEISS